jgi:uncharacterized protein (DUF58 family)
MKIWRRLQGAWQRRLATWVRRRQGADTLPVEIRRQRLYILPTKAGLGLGALLLFMLLAGLNYGNNLALLATFLLMGFVLIGMNLCHRNLQGLRIVAATTRSGFAGGQGQLELTLDGRGDPDRWAIAVATEQAGHRVHEVAPHIVRHGSARLELTIPTPRRGRQEIERFELSTTFPFGLFRAWTWVHLPLAITVYPAATGTRPLPLGRDIQDSGESNTALGSDEWSGIRPFRDGDSPRQVIWTAYARELPLLVKEYAGAAAEWLSLDFEALVGVDTESRLQQICRWILEADQRGARYALAIPGRQFPPDCSAAHRQKCLEALALWQHRSGAP